MKATLPVRQAAIAAGIALPLLSSAASAADPSQRVVVTAARAPQTAEQLIADVVVIDAEQIARAGPISLGELLQRHAGAELSANGGPGQVSGMFLRGTSTNHVVLLIDGVRVNSATTGTNALEHVPLSQIERIEVLRGPASSLYGADAIGGVIQIFTRTVDGIRAKAGVGSDHLRELSAGIGRVVDDTSWSLHAGGSDVEAFSATNSTHPFSFNPDDDPYRNVNLNARVQHRWAEGHRITLRGLATRATTHFDSGLGSDDINKQRLASIALESDDRISDVWRSTVRLARGSDHLHTDGAFPSTFDTDQDQVTWQNDLKFGSRRRDRRRRMAARRRDQRHRLHADRTPHHVGVRRRAHHARCAAARRLAAHRPQLAVRHPHHRPRRRRLCARRRRGASRRRPARRSARRRSTTCTSRCRSASPAIPT